MSQRSSTPARSSARGAGRAARAARTAVAALLSAAVLAGLAVPSALADDLEDQRRRTEQQRQRTDRAVEGLTADLEDTDADLVAAQAELERIQARIPIAEAELAKAEAELARLQREAEIIAERLAVAEELERDITAQLTADAERAAEIRVAIGRMARDAYKGDMAASALATVLDATSTEEFVTQSAMASTALRTQTQALRELEQLNGANRNREARQAAVREQIAELKKEADAKVVEAEKARAAAEARKLELEDLRAAEQERIAQIEAKRAEQLAKMEELRAQQAQLEADLKKIIAAQAEQRRKAEEERKRREAEERRRGGSGGSGGGSSGGSSGGGSSSGALLGWPSPMKPPYITSHYGWRLHPVLGYRRLHAGTDFRAYCGTSIIAARSGTVEWARYRGGYGNQVMLDHGWVNGSSLMTSYNHLSSFAVRPGQKVSQGQVVGYSGTTGTSTACHLHFEVYINGTPVNPIHYLP